MLLKLDCVSKQFKRPVNVITPVEKATERTQSIYGVKDGGCVGEETDNGEVNKGDFFCVGAEAGKGGLNKLEG